MDATTKRLYDQHKKELMISYSVIETAKIEGKAEVKVQVIISSFNLGLDIPTISQITKLSEDQVIKILKENSLIN
jgi:hypothetical protein